jgi:apoptosis-resistant E3 ubiquitin protein ligase 1
MEPVQPLVQWLWVEVMHRLLIHVTFLDQGVYVLRVKFQKILLNKGEFSVIVLTKKEADSVEKTLQVPSLPMSYEARVLSINGDRASKSKKVYCTVTPKQLAVKEYILGFIPKRLATFRLCPSTKVILMHFLYS